MRWAAYLERVGEREREEVSTEVSLQILKERYLLEDVGFSGKCF